MSTDTLRPSSPDPSSIALPPSPRYSPSQLPVNDSSDEATRQRLGVDFVYRPHAIQTDEVLSPSGGPPPSGVPRRAPLFSSLTSKPSLDEPDPPSNPDFALMAFQTQSSLAKLVHALRQVDMSNSILEHQAYQQERAKRERQAALAAGESPTRSSDGPRVWKVERVDGNRLVVDNNVVGRLAETHSPSEEERQYRRQLRDAQAQYASEEAKMKQVAEELRKAQLETEQQEAESTDRDEEEDVARVLRSGKKKKKKGKKKRPQVSQAAEEVSTATLEGVGAAAKVEEEGKVGAEAAEDEVEDLIRQEWAELEADQGMENFHRSHTEYIAKHKQGEEEKEREDFGEVSVSALAEATAEFTADRKAQSSESAKANGASDVPVERDAALASEDVDANWMEGSPEVDGAKSARKKPTKAKPVVTKSEEEGVLAQAEKPAEPSESADVPEVNTGVSTIAKFASKTVFDQLGPSGSSSALAITPAALDETSNDASEKATRSKRDAKKDARKLARAEKFKDITRGESGVALAESQTSSTVASAASVPPSSVNRINVDAAARKAAWKAEKRVKARQAKALPPPASMPGVSIAPPAVPVPPAVTAPAVAPVMLIPAQTPAATERHLADDEPTPRAFTVRPLIDDDKTPTWPTVRLPTVSFQQHQSPGSLRPSLPPAPTLVATFGSIDVLKGDDVPTLLTTYPSTSTVSETESTLSVSIIEPREPISPAPTVLRFGTISPDNLAQEAPETTVEAELEKIREEIHGRSLTAPAREALPDPRKATASRSLKQASQPRNVSSPAAIQYEESPRELPAQIILPTPPPAPAAMLHAPIRILARPTAPATAATTAAPALPAPQYWPTRRASPETTPEAPTRPNNRFTPLFPSITPGIPIELAIARHVPVVPDPANEPAPPSPQDTPDQPIRAYIPLTAPAVVSTRPLVAPILAGPLLSELSNARARAPVVYPSLAALPMESGLPLQPIPRSSPGPLSQLLHSGQGEEVEDAESSSTSSDEVIVRLPPPPSRKPTPQPQSTAATSQTEGKTAPPNRKSTPQPLSVTSVAVAVPAQVHPNVIAQVDQPEAGRNEAVSSASASPRSTAASLLSNVAVVPAIPEKTIVEETIDQPVVRPSNEAASAVLVELPPPVAIESGGSEIVQALKVGETGEIVEAVATVVNEAAVTTERDEEVALAKDEEQGVEVAAPMPPAAPTLTPIVVSNLPPSLKEPTISIRVEPPALVPTPNIPGNRSLFPSPVVTTSALPSRPFTIPALISTPLHRITSEVSRPLFQSPPSEDPYGPCPLARSWTLYFADTSPNAARPRAALPSRAHYSGALVPIFTAGTAEDFFGSWKAFRRLLAGVTNREIEPLGATMPRESGGLGIQGLKEDNSFHLFTKGVLPMWEDPMAEKGGKMMFAGKPSEAVEVDYLFLQIVQLLISGIIEHECPLPDTFDVCVLGATLAKRKANIRAEVWLGGSVAPPKEWVRAVNDLLVRHFPTWKLYPYKPFK